MIKERELIDGELFNQEGFSFDVKVLEIAYVAM
jgi:hypothetical protein